MSEFIVHNIPGSPYGRAVLATLAEKDARYRLVPIAPGTMRSEPHISRRNLRAARGDALTHSLEPSREPQFAWLRRHSVRS